MTEDSVHVGSGNVFSDIGMPDADTHVLKAKIVSNIMSIVKDKNITQKEVGKIIGISQPEVSRLFRGHFREYSVERLMKFITSFNRDVEISVKKRSDNNSYGRMIFNPEEASI